MTTVADVSAWLQEFAPPDLAEEWDNVGLLMGMEDGTVRRVLTCLTLTGDVAEEAIAEKIDLIVTHHPILFRKVRRLTSQTTEGRMLLQLAAHQVSVYSPHTSYDSAAGGVNQQLAESFGLEEIRPIRKTDVEDEIGAGRIGNLSEPLSLEDFLTHARDVFAIDHLQFTRGDGRQIARVAIACGSAAEFLSDAAALGADVLVTGEARFHALLEARELGTAMVQLGHYNSERPAVESLATALANAFPKLTVAASQAESDPLEWA